ncbi:MFS transporter [Streptomyces sp. NPDC059786]|uniref:MFS transporter n=1 Tax=Streptomyces sp. NPDC059786 TaxID=3346946 RepID=UPI00365E9BC6
MLDSTLTRPGRRRIALLAAAGAVTAANVYLNQPLLGEAARSFGVAPDVLGYVPTATQLGYAAGIALLVPAGDLRDRRRLILALGAGSSLALAAAAAAPTALWLAVAGLVIGVLSPIPQLVAPLAVALEKDLGTGRVVGLVQSGLLVGVLASRTYAGALASAAGWRWVFAVSAAGTALLTWVLRKALPRDAAAPAPERRTLGYRAALASLPGLFAHDRLVRRVTLSGLLVGVSFGAFWTVLTYLLDEHYHYGSTRIGLFGLVAAASALVSPSAGRLADRLGRRGALALPVCVVLAGWALLYPGGTGGTGPLALVWLTAGVVVLDVGTWSQQVVCQTSLFTREPAVHSRLNTLYFALRFLGIAAGSLTGARLWAQGGWPAVCAAGAVAAALGLLVAVTPERTARTPDTRCVT